MDNLLQILRLIAFPVGLLAMVSIIPALAIDMIRALRRYGEDVKSTRQPIRPEDYQDNRFSTNKAPLSLLAFGAASPLTATNHEPLVALLCIPAAVIVYWATRDMGDAVIALEDGCVRHYIGDKLVWSVAQDAIRDIRVSVFTVNNQGGTSKTIFLVTEQREHAVILRKYPGHRRLRQLLFGLLPKSGA